MHVTIQSGGILDIYWVIRRHSRTTLCVIEFKPAVGNRVQSADTGLAVCSFNDVYDENKGQKISLTRALRSGGFGRDDRFTVWLAYYMSSGNKW
jgi:hypothetical protein